MGRKPRIEYYGAIYHIIQRGNNRKSIFKEDREKAYLLEILSETKEIFDFKIFAYVIMNNHYHFLIQAFNIPISKIMHRINTRYAKYYNYKMKRTGPVFEDRYTGILVQDEGYLFTLIRYIHNNPVSAKICKTMDEYKWSSDIFYRINMVNMVDIDEFLNMLSLNRTKAIEKYIELMEEDFIDDEIMKDIYERSSIIGTDEFKRSIEDIEEKDLSGLDRILRQACPSDEEVELIKKGSRKRYLTKYKRRYIELSKEEGYSYDEIGKNIGITGSAIRSILKGRDLND
ncbi:MAG: hypothetical protein GX987_09155 [Tissierellia bacterium]|nr:hypothetical protein [Tissierellia bacterium]